MATKASSTKAFKEAEKLRKAEETAKMVKTAKESSKVLNAYRIEKFGDRDAIVYERVVVPERYAGQPGVKEFVALNGDITYYVERKAKKFSENVAISE